MELTSADNGIKFLYEFDNSPVVCCGFVVNAGTRDERPDEHGLAHLIEHLLFGGTHKRSNLQIIKRLEDVGGELNAYTTKEETYIYALVPQRYTERAVELLSDIVFDSVFPENQIAKEREVMFENSALGHNILGSKKSLSKLTQSDCINFVKRCYTTDNMLFFLQGNIAENKFVRLIEKYVIRETTTRQFHRSLPQIYTPKEITKNKKTSQTHCLIGNLTLSLSDKDTTCLTLLNNILGGTGLTSKLNLSVRERNGWVYAIDSSINLYSDVGVWCIYFGCSENNYQKCINLINKELYSLTDKPISARQLERYKQQLYGQILINSQNKENYLLSAAKIALHLSKSISLEKTLEQIKQISPENIQLLASQLFNNKDFTVLKYK